MLTKAHRQEALSRAFVQAIAARCGLSFSVRGQDYGIDMTLHEIEYRNGFLRETGFALDVQLRSTSGSVSGSHVVYDIDVRTYDLLRTEPPANPRVLVLLVLPEAETDWTAQTEVALELRRCAYWHSLLGLPETDNRSSVRIQIPRSQVFSVEAVTEIIDRIRRGEPLWP